MIIMMVAILLIPSAFSILASTDAHTGNGPPSGYNEAMENVKKRSQQSSTTGYEPDVRPRIVDKQGQITPPIDIGNISEIPGAVVGKGPPPGYNEHMEKVKKLYQQIGIEPTKTPLPQGQITPPIDVRNLPLSPSIYVGKEPNPAYTTEQMRKAMELSHYNRTQ